MEFYIYINYKIICLSGSEMFHFITQNVGMWEGIKKQHSLFATLGSSVSLAPVLEPVADLGGCETGC